MSVRAAQPADAAALAEIWNAVIRDTAFTFTDREKPLSEVADLIAARAALGQPVLVAETGGMVGGVVGFATYAPFRAGPGYARCMEHSVHLAAAARGQGLGRALMQALQGQARAAGHHTLIGAVSGANPGGIAFHLAVGFVQVGRVAQAGWKRGAFHDLVLMQKIL